MFDLSVLNNYLDVSDWPQTGRKLVKRVVESVKPSDLIYTQPPNLIILSQTQYDSLLDAEELQFMTEYSEVLNQVTQSKDKLFYTPTCVMEVRIKGGDYATSDPETPKSN
jgi:hypothetical protein